MLLALTGASGENTKGGLIGDASVLNALSVWPCINQVEAKELSGQLRTDCSSLRMISSVQGSGSSGV